MGEYQNNYNTKSGSSTGPGSTIDFAKEANYILDDKVDYGIRHLQISKHMHQKQRFHAQNLSVINMAIMEKISRELATIP